MPGEQSPSIDPSLRSWVASANDPGTDFPIQNLPLGAAFLPDVEEPVLVVAIGDHVADLGTLADAGVFDQDLDPEDVELLADATGAPALMEEGAHVLSAVRAGLARFLRDGPPGGQPQRRLREKAVVPAQDVELTTPCVVPNYTDFYASIHHATTVGSMFRPDNPLLPNYTWVPIGYHGRASSIVPSGIPVTRPKGQLKPDDPPGGFAPPAYGPCKLLDYELEMGLIIGRPTELGQTVPIARAREHILGLCLVNDWSARDIQKWEYQPLGPFLAKNFATSIGQWIVTLDALEPFRCPASPRPAGAPAPLPYLLDPDDQARGGFDITLEVAIASAAMRSAGVPHAVVSRSNLRDLYWTLAQLVAHHASNGCNLLAGDLLASGTVSGPAPDARGCLLELTWDGPGAPRKPIALPTGETRLFLADGDEVVLRAWCEKPWHRRIGFGECRAVVAPAGV